MNPVQRLVAGQWDNVSSRFPEPTRIWAASILAGTTTDLELQVLANLIERDQEAVKAHVRAASEGQKADLAERRTTLARREEIAAKDKLEEVRSQLTTMNNVIIRKLTSSKSDKPVQQLFDEFVERSERTDLELRAVKEAYERRYRQLESLAHDLGHKGSIEGLDISRLAAQVRQDADAKDSYKRLATARRVRLCEINAALECEDAQVFQKIDDLQGIVGIATNTLTDLRSVLEIPADVEIVEGTTLLVDMMEEVLGVSIAMEGALQDECGKAGLQPDGPVCAVRELGLRVRNGQKAIDDFIALIAARDEALTFYADPANHQGPGFFSATAIDQDQGARARDILYPGKIIQMRRPA